MTTNPIRLMLCALAACAGAALTADVPAAETPTPMPTPAATAPALPAATSASRPDSPLAAQRTIKAIWKARKQYLLDGVNAKLARRETVALYELQGSTNALLEYAACSGDSDVLDGLSELYLTAHGYLRPEKTYVYHYLPGHGRLSTLPLDPPEEMWASAGGEVVLDVSQFLHAAARATSVVLDVKADRRTEQMKQLVNKFAPTLKAHYQRWVFGSPGVFQVTGWGGDAGTFDHYHYLEKKADRKFTGPGYCNAVDDVDMWVLAGVVEMLAAHQKDPAAVPLEKEQAAKFLNYVALGTRLLKSRLTESPLKDFNGEPVTGWNFDLGAWDAHPDYDYTGYVGATFPTAGDRKAAKGVGWDISHARRFVFVFDTLHNNRDVTGQTLPTREDMTRLANQLVYGAFNRDFVKPLFTNVMDGTNGWYRVNYSGRKNFGYGPYGECNAVPTGGYGLWSRYNPDVTRVTDALWKMIRTVAPDGTPERPGDGAGREIAEHVAKYYSPSYAQPNSLDLMALLASKVHDWDLTPAVKPTATSRPTDRSASTPVGRRTGQTALSGSGGMNPARDRNADYQCGGLGNSGIHSEVVYVR